MKRTMVNEARNWDQEFNTEILLKGWIRTKRDSKGGFSFLEINDGSCFGNIQIVADKELENYESEILKLFPGSSVSIKGIIVESPGKGQNAEIQAKEIKVYGFCDVNTYPIQKQRLSPEKLREIAHIRPRTNTFGAVTRVRNELIKATHEFYQSKGFLNIHTPIITGNDCEGAGQMFQVTTLDMNRKLKENETVDYADDFFGKKTHLTVSGQLEAETYACALGNVYTFGPTFRAENSNTTRHLSEFWMVEPEMAFADIQDDMDLAEDYLKHLCSSVLNNCAEDMEFFQKRISKTIIEKLQNITENSFERISYTDAVKILVESNKKFEFKPEWGIDLQTEHERYLTEEKFKKPVIIIDYPKNIKAFYMKANDDEKTVAAMDVLVPEIGEIIGGSQREDDFDKLSKRIKEMEIDIDEYWWYLDLRKFGSVPHAGFGLGFERAVQFCTGMANIRDVIPFPRTPRNADF
ncbi:MAG: asparagine--tRNA ligase [Planctomycetota bacterium]|nr:MAG: asparagine--tRNA ligase [Planctomycetota bacterium]